jgi:hypothetical protein
MADLREALTSALEAHESAEVVTPPVVETPEVITPPAGETTEQRAARERDEAGRFKAKEDGSPVAKAPAVAAAPVAPAVEPRKAPSSWKKDYWEAYQALDPKVADYIAQREEQFANGVSTYKQEADRARELFDAIAPFQADLQQHGVQPAQWLRQLGTAHQMLVKGSPEQKLQAFHKLAQDYRVPVDALLDPNVRQQFLTSQPPPPPQDVGKLVEEKFMQVQATTEIERFAADPSHEHFEAVRETMRQLLDTGLATDLKSAYDKAVRMDPELFEREQLRVSEAAERQRRDQAAAKVNTARANAVSPRSATPAGAMTGSGKKDLRSTLEDAVEATLGGARV